MFCTRAGTVRSATANGGGQYAVCDAEAREGSAPGFRTMGAFPLDLQLHTSSADVIGSRHGSSEVPGGRGGIGLNRSVDVVWCVRACACVRACDCVCVRVQL